MNYTVFPYRDLVSHIFFSLNEETAKIVVILGGPFPGEKRLHRNVRIAAFSPSMAPLLRLGLLFWSEELALTLGNILGKILCMLTSHQNVGILLFFASQGANTQLLSKSRSWIYHTTSSTAMDSNSFSPLMTFRASNFDRRTRMTVCASTCHRGKKIPSPCRYHRNKDLKDPAPATYKLGLRWVRRKDAPKTRFSGLVTFSGPSTDF